MISGQFLRCGLLATVLPPVVAHCGLLVHDLIEVRMLADRDFSKQPLLPHLDSLQPHHFQQRQNIPARLVAVERNR